MNTNRKPTAAFVLSLIAGITVIFTSSLWCIWLTTNWNMHWMDEAMHGWEEHMYAWNLRGFTYILGIIGIISGIMIVAASIMLYLKTTSHELWGALIIVFSVTSILSCMGGFGIGLILGVSGGALAIFWKPLEEHK